MKENHKKSAFTLAEVLIVIGVIGAVAALTIPTLINIISTKAEEAQTKTIEARLLDGINRFSAIDDGLSQKYETTYDFLQALSKHYKMADICDTENIENCIPYSKIYSSDGSKSVDVKSLKTINSFMSGEAAKNYLEPASFISAQGTPVVMALKKNCVWDMGQAMKSIEDSDCIAYLYDKNGAGLPNRLGDDSDIVGHGLTVNGFPLAILGGVKIMTNAFEITNGLTKSQCLAEVADKNTYKTINSEVYIKACYYEDDRWAAAMKTCKDQGYHLPTDEQYSAIANALYTNNGSINIASIPDALSGLVQNWQYLWSASLPSYSYDGRANTWRFYWSWAHNEGSAVRYYTDKRGVCVSD